MAKTGKDREGNYTPPKGRPSDNGHGAASSETIEEVVEYAENDDKLLSNAIIRHPNRNVNKRDVRAQKNDVPPPNAGAQQPQDGVQAPRMEEVQIRSGEDFNTLANQQYPHCASVFMPTHPSGVEVNEQVDAIVFKNALQRVTAGLKEQHVDAEQIQRIIKPAQQLLKDASFWRDQSHGLAVFLADGFAQYCRLPYAPAQDVHVNAAFYMAPLTPLILSKDRFYLVSLSKKKVQVFKADAFGMTPIDISEMPNGMEDVIHFEEKDDKNLFRTGSSGAGKGANYHGMGAGVPDDKKNISIYLDEVDETLWKEILGRENCPVLLAGVEYLTSIYRQQTKYKNIWPESLNGNFEYTDMHTLYNHAREVMQPHFRERAERACEEYGNKSATALTTSEVADIVPAAYYGRVATLLVRKGDQLWGTFNAQSNELRVHEARQGGDESLYEKAIVRTIQNGGEVHELEPAAMPVDASLAAIMRY
jgi:hypothetical protein